MLLFSTQKEVDGEKKLRMFEIDARCDSYDDALSIAEQILLALRGFITNEVYNLEMIRILPLSYVLNDDGEEETMKYIGGIDLEEGYCGNFQTYFDVIDKYKMFDYTKKENR